METQQLDNTVYEAAANTFESLAMMFLVTEDEAPVSSWPPRRVGVGFEGEFSGSLVLEAPDGLLPELAANMLGLEVAAAASRGIQIDAFKELANVICGNVLPAIAGSEPVFHIAAPVALPDGAEDPPAGVEGKQGALAGAARLHTEVGTVDVKLYLAAGEEGKVACRTKTAGGAAGSNDQASDDVEARR